MSFFERISTAAIYSPSSYQNGVLGIHEAVEIGAKGFVAHYARPRCGEDPPIGHCNHKRRHYRGLLPLLSLRLLFRTAGVLLYYDRSVLPHTPHLGPLDSDPIPLKVPDVNVACLVLRPSRRVHVQGIWFNRVSLRLNRGAPRALMCEQTCEKGKGRCSSFQHSASLPGGCFLRTFSSL